ncbi:MAG: YhjD/YihY/BrkB family envelope integrity protein, partial [Candidatus Brocadiia bacterium]|nr:YhjD/YihY/BrkB family envelope integrity protein [Candidatus Brocadiia bacterium]
MGELLKRVRDLIEDIRWEDAANPSRWVQFLRGQVRLYFYVARETVRDHCPQRAAALTFTTLLSLVPLMAVAFSLFRAFPAFQGLERKAERAILHTMLSDVFVEGARVPVGADASPDQALDDGAEGGGSATDLLRRADEHPRMAASRE